MDLDSKGVEKAVTGLVDIIDGNEEKHLEEKAKYKKILKDIRKALNGVPIFSSDPLKDHKIACGTISEILEEHGF